MWTSEKWRKVLSLRCSAFHSSAASWRNRNWHFFIAHCKLWRNVFLLSPSRRRCNETSQRVSAQFYQPYCSSIKRKTLKLWVHTGKFKKQIRGENAVRNLNFIDKFLFLCSLQSINSLHALASLCFKLCDVRRDLLSSSPPFVVSARLGAQNFSGMIFDAAETSVLFPVILSASTITIIKFSRLRQQHRHDKLPPFRLPRCSATGSDDLHCEESRAFFPT